MISVVTLKTFLYAAGSYIHFTIGLELKNVKFDIDQLPKLILLKMIVYGGNDKTALGSYRCSYSIHIKVSPFYETLSLHENI